MCDTTIFTKNDSGFVYCSIRLEYIFEYYVTKKFCQENNYFHFSASKNDTHELKSIWRIQYGAISYLLIANWVFEYEQIGTRILEYYVKIIKKRFCYEDNYLPWSIYTMLLTFLNSIVNCLWTKIKLPLILTLLQKRGRWIRIRLLCCSIRFTYYFHFLASKDDINELRSIYTNWLL